MKVLVSGATGLIGSALTPLLASRGYEIVRLVRRTPQKGEIAWDPVRGKLDAASLEGFDMVVNLAGEPIVDGKWTAEKKIKIRDSRVRGTQHLSETLATLANRPKLLVSASAVGYYGHRSDEVLPETIMPGMDFLSRVCREWEVATDPASAAGIRVVNTRFGIVLAPKGGALEKMITPFKLGLGATLGD